MRHSHAYSLERTSSQEPILIAEHADLVKKIAHHLLARLPPSVQIDDLIQAGMIGLLEAQQNYDSSKGASFVTYAGIRIRGAMIDEIRKGDWAPRSVHRNTRRITEAVTHIEHTTGRDARDADVAEHLGLTLDAYHKILQDSNGVRVFAFEDLSQGDDHFYDHIPESDPGPLEGVQSEDFREKLAQVVGTLPERERLILSLYYDEDLNLREIGDVLGVSESRISQILGKAMIRLQARMQNYL